MTIKSYVALFVFLASCSTITNTPVKDKLDNTARKKIFELDLTDPSISSEGGGIELFKEKEYCNLELSLYGESGQQKYNFLFKEKI